MKQGTQSVSSGSAPPRSVKHAHGCDCNPVLHRYKCRHCKRVVGWCMGAHDAVERASGPICDDCVYLLSTEDGSLLDLAETLEQMERDPAVRAAAAHYDETVKKILGGEKRARR